MNKFFRFRMATAITIAALIALLGATSAFAGGSQENGSSASGKISLKVNDIGAPNSIQDQALHKFKTEIEQKSNGKITVQIFSSGTLFGQKDQTAALEQGQVDMILCAAQDLATQVPKLGYFGSAYAFKNYTAMNEVLNGPYGKTIFQEVAKVTGALPLGAWYLGSRELNYKDIGHEIKTPQDLQGVKLRMPDAPAWLALGQALGAKPVPISFTEVYTALQTGTIDAQDNPLTIDRDSKFYEVAKNISLTNHVIDSEWPTFNLQKWNSLSKSDQDMIQQALNDAGQWMSQQTIDQEKSLVDWFKQHGVNIVHPDVNAFYQYAQNWYKTHPSATKGWDQSMIDEVNKVNNSVK